MQKINNIQDFLNAINHPYRSGEFFTNDEGNIFTVPDNMDEVQELIDSNDDLIYGVNIQDDSLYSENGNKIPPIYEK